MSKQQSSAESAELTVREALAGVVELYEHHTSRSGENMYFPAEEIERRWSLARAALAQPQTARSEREAERFERTGLHVEEAQTLDELDPGAAFIIHNVDDTVTIQVRSPGDRVFSEVEMPLDAWTKLRCVGAHSQAESAATTAWECSARKQGTAGGNNPSDCDWPGCGCDPQANKVLEAIDEAGFEIVRKPEIRRMAHPQPQANNALRGFGWRSDCPACVASKMVCDAHGSALMRPQAVCAEPSEAQIYAAAEVIWNDRDARMGGPWKGRGADEVCVIQTRATARAALVAALTRPLLSPTDKANGGQS
jgi:hypothetical protein